MDILCVISRSIIMCNIYVNYNRKPNKYFLFRLVRRPVKTCRFVILQCIAEVFLLAYKAYLWSRDNISCGCLNIHFTIHQATK